MDRIYQIGEIRKGVEAYDRVNRCWTTVVSYIGPDRWRVTDGEAIWVTLEVNLHVAG